MPSPGRREPPPVLDKVRQGVLGRDIHRLGISSGVAEGLHHQVGAEANKTHLTGSEPFNPHG
jgi:hypothetical protein